MLEFGGISHLHGSAVGKGGENGELAPDAGRGFREDDDPIRHADGFGDIVGDQKRGFPFFTQDLPDVITDGKSGLIIRARVRISAARCRIPPESWEGWEKRKFQSPYSCKRRSTCERDSFVFLF